jgi:molecular chaperone GrpE
VSDESLHDEEAAADELEESSPAAPLDGDVAADVEEDLDELSAMTKERDELRAMAQRLQADFENYRKRVARQSEETAARLCAELVSSLLPVLDALDLAEAHLDLSGELSEEAKALVAARRLLVDTLSKQGLEQVAGAESLFDPTLHDAVAHAEGEGGAEGPVVDEVLRAGYSFRGSVVRPAMVRVRG